MKNKILMSTIVFLIGITSYGQVNHKEYHIKDTTKVKLIRNSLYLAYNEIVYNSDTAWSVIKYSKVDLSNVTFRKSKSEILSRSFNQLDSLSNVLLNNPQINIQIKGHTDKIGNSRLNLKLSKKRAKNIKVYLKRAGIKSNRITTFGFGDNFPICPSPCEKNRRVELVAFEH